MHTTHTTRILHAHTVARARARNVRFAYPHTTSSSTDASTRFSRLNLCEKINRISCLHSFATGKTAPWKSTRRVLRFTSRTDFVLSRTNSCPINVDRKSDSVRDDARTGEILVSTRLGRLCRRV